MTASTQVRFQPVADEVDHTPCRLCCASGPITVTAIMDSGIYAEGMKRQYMIVSQG